MKRSKLVQGLLIVLFAGVLGSVGYLLASLALRGEEGGQTGPVSVYATPVPFADFTLTDQRGETFSSASTRGKVVLVSFLFTHCGDVCPFSAIKMRETLAALGIKASEVELLAVSTDPERDTVPVLAAYSRDLGLYDRWHFVTGDLATMQTVYKDLRITVIKTEEEPIASPETGAEGAAAGDSALAGLTAAEVAAGNGIAKKYAGGYNIAHSAPFWVVDREGRIRASLDVSASPAQLAEAVKTYLD